MAVADLSLFFLQITFVFIYFCYPEGAGLTLEETGTLFTDGFGVRKADELRKAKKSAGVNDVEGSLGEKA